MPASSIEKTITNRIERWVNQAPGAEKVESKSVPGVSVVKIYFRDDIDPNAALTLTTSLAQGTLPTLPPNTLPPVVLPFDPTGTMPLGILTVSNPGMDEAHVKDIARIDVRNMLGRRAGLRGPGGGRRQGPHHPDLSSSRKNSRPATCRRSTWSMPCSRATSW